MYHFLSIFSRKKRKSWLRNEDLLLQSLLMKKNLLFLVLAGGGLLIGFAFHTVGVFMHDNEPKTYAPLEFIAPSQNSIGAPQGGGSCG